MKQLLGLLAMSLMFSVAAYTQPQKGGAKQGSAARPEVG